MADLKKQNPLDVREAIDHLNHYVKASADELRELANKKARDLVAVAETLSTPERLGDLYEKATLAVVHDDVLDVDPREERLCVVQLDLRWRGGFERRFPVLSEFGPDAPKMKPGRYRFFVFAVPLDK